MISKKLDEYEFQTTDKAEFLAEITDMEENSKWIHNVSSTSLSINPCTGPLFVMEEATDRGDDVEVAMDTAGGGFPYCITDGCHNYYLRDTARSTLLETARLNGAALVDMAQDKFAGTINFGLSVARRKSLLLMRFGKVSAIHSDAAKGYEIIPITDLFKTTDTKLSEIFGETTFRLGYNTHGYSQAYWVLNDAAPALIEMYQKAIETGVSDVPIIEPHRMIPAVKFCSSDTAHACASLRPVFLCNGSEVSFSEGIKVEHSRKKLNAKTPAGKEMTGLETYEDEIKGIYSQFRDTADKIAEMSMIEITHGENCVINLCKKYNIPKKYGEYARDTIVRFGKDHIVSAHDVYLVMASIVGNAKKMFASSLVTRNLQDNISRIPFCDWATYDVGGTATW